MKSSSVKPEMQYDRIHLPARPCIMHIFQYLTFRTEFRYLHSRANHRLPINHSTESYCATKITQQIGKSVVNLSANSYLQILTCYNKCFSNKVTTNSSCSATWVWTALYARLNYFHHVTLHNSERYIILIINYVITKLYMDTFIEV